MYNTMKTQGPTIILCLLSYFVSFGQDRPIVGIDIKNSNEDLKQNKVYSITQTTYNYSNWKKKLVCNVGRKEVTELYDSLGRNFEKIYFRDSAQFFARVKYFYADTTGKRIYRIESYNNKDSLVTINIAEERNGQMIYYMPDRGGVWCFGNYKFIYNEKGLIEEAIWYGPKKGIWANDKMRPYHTTKLTYSFRQ